MNLEKLMQNEEFTKKLESAQNLDEVLAMVKEQGVEITKEEVEAALKKLDEGELDENSLEDVAGGIAGWIMIGGGIRTLAKWLKKYGPHVFFPI